MDHEVSGLMFSYANKSQYHDRCLPPDRQQNQSSQQPLTSKQLEEVDVITRDKVWKETVASEQRGLKQWEESWSFLTEYDPMGKPRQKIIIPKETNGFSTGPVTNTSAANYGSQLGTDNGKLIRSLENNLGAQNRKKKQDSEMICY